MTVVGAVVLVLAVVAGVLGARQAFTVLPIGVLSTDGSPGGDVLAVLDAPGELEVDLDADTSYAVILARPVGSGAAAPRALEDEVVVVGPDGEEVRVRSASVDMESTMGGTHAASIAGFTTQQAGTHRILAPAPVDGGQAQVLLTEEVPFDEFFSGLAGLLAAGVVATLLGLIGLGLLVGGIVWWVMARKPRPGPPQASPPPGYGAPVPPSGLVPPPPGRP